MCGALKRILFHLEISHTHPRPLYLVRLAMGYALYTIEFGNLIRPVVRVNYILAPNVGLAFSYAWLVDR